MTARASVTPDPASAFLTRLEAAAALGCTESQVATLLRHGRLQRRPGARRGQPSILASSVEPARAALDGQCAARAAAAARRAAHGTPPATGDEWLTTTQTAAALGLSRAWVRQRAGNQRIPATWHGDQWWIRQNDVDQLRRVREFTRSTHGENVTDPSADARVGSTQEG